MFKEIKFEPKKDKKTKEEQILQFTDLNMIDDIINKLEKLEVTYKEIKESTYKKEFKKILEKNRKAVYLGESILQLMRKVPENYGIRDTSLNMKSNGIPDSLYPEEVKIFIENECVHIVMKDLLPRRQTDQKKYYNYDYERYKYVKAFHTFFKDKNIFYNERVIILFKHFFTNDSDMVDYDNMDTKIIMDCITTYILVDDNPKRYMKTEDYAIGENRHSEVIIFPMNMWIKYLDLPF